MMIARAEPGGEVPHGLDDPVSRPRWAQLTYSSFDRHDGRGGGWQVKDTTGDPTEAEVEFLRARVQTQFDAGIDLPRFPTPAEIAELPRRLIQAPAPVHGGETALWHHVPAGNDASGRPGNVFAHVVLDRLPGAADPIRPIERWRSAGWLTPFGPEEVLAADLTATDPPGPGPLNRQTIGSWLFAPRQWRLQILAVLLDAVRAAMAGGPMVVLGVDDVDEAANWIAAISFAMSSGTARRFHFSTLERPTTLTEAIERELHLVCIPRSDLPALQRRHDCVVVDPDGAPNLGDLDGEPHRTARGDRVPVTEWSVLISELFADPRAMQKAVGEFDRIAHRVGDSGIDPAWPAAMAIAGRADVESRREANRVMTDAAPPQLRSVPELYAAAVAGLRRDVKGRASRAWRHLTKVGADRDDRPADIPGEMAVHAYAELALADEPWLAEHGPARVPSAAYFSPAPEASLLEAARTLDGHISTFTTELPPEVMLDEARAGLHYVELALRLGLAHDAHLAGQLWQICQQTLIPVLVDHGLGTQLLDEVDGVIVPEARHWLWSQLNDGPLEQLGPPGQRLSDAALDALGPGAGDPDPLAATWLRLTDDPGAGSAVRALLGEYAWRRVRGGDEGPDARFFAVWSVLAQYADDGNLTGLAAAAPLLTPPFTADRLVQLHRAFGPVVPIEWYLPAVVAGSSDDPQSQELRDELAERPDPSAIRDFAGIRGALELPDWLDVVDPGHLVPWLGVLAEVLGRAKQLQAEPDAELLRRVNGLVVLALLAARARSPQVDAVAVERAAGLAQAAVAGFPNARPGLTAEELTAMGEWCDRHEVTTTGLAELLLLADPRSALRSNTDRVAGWLHAVPTGEPDSPPVTAHVLAVRASRNAESRDQVAAEIMHAVRTTPGSTDDRAMRQAERFLLGWLRQAQTGRVRR